jgi:hypothetical protein
MVAKKATGPTAALAAREPRESDQLGGLIGSEAKVSQAKDQPKTALAAAFRAALERVAQR